MKPFVFETCYGKITIERGSDGKPLLAYFHQGDHETTISPGGFFKDFANTEFNVNYARGEACLFVMSPREIGRIKT
jgi:hypothetical protein